EARGSEPPALRPARPAGTPAPAGRTRRTRAGAGRGPAPRANYGRVVMRTGRRWVGAGLGVALLLSLNNRLRAQAPPPGGEALPTPGPGKPVPLRGAIAPSGPEAGFTGEHAVDGHNNHGENHHVEHHAVVEEESHEEGSARGLFFVGEYLYVRPRRRANDF